MGIPTTLLEMMVGLTALWGITFIRPFHLKKLSWRLPLTLVGLFFLAATISMLMVPSVTFDINGDLVESARLAQGIWKGWMVMPLVYFLMICFTSKDREWWSRTFKFLAISGFVMGAWAIGQMMTENFSTWDGRASGPFESANYLSLYLAPVILMTFAEWLKAFKGRLWKRVVWQFALAVMVLGLWGSQSYAAFIALAVGVIFYLIFTKDLTIRLKKIAFISMVVIGLIGLLTQLDTPKFQQFLDFSDRTSSSVRIEVYTIATKLIQQHPWVGIGLGQFEVQYQVNAPEILGHAPYEWVMLHPHNLFLALWLNTGLLGLLAMMGLVGWIFWRGFHNKKKHLWERWFHQIKGGVASPEFQIRLIGLSMLVVILVHGLFDTPFFKNDLAYLWWLVLAMGL
jgi:O-antigen ligase